MRYFHFTENIDIGAARERALQNKDFWCSVFTKGGLTWTNLHALNIAEYREAVEAHIFWRDEWQTETKGGQKMSNAEAQLGALYDQAIKLNCLLKCLASVEPDTNPADMKQTAFVAADLAEQLAIGIEDAGIAVRREGTA